MCQEDVSACDHETRHSRPVAQMAVPAPQSMCVCCLCATVAGLVLQNAVPGDQQRGHRGALLAGSHSGRRAVRQALGSGQANWQALVRPFKIVSVCLCVGLGKEKRTGEGDWEGGGA